MQQFRGRVVEPVSRLTAKAQTTIPKAVREALSLEPGDTLVYEIQGDAVRVRKATPVDLTHLRGLRQTLSEWESPEDSAYDDL